ncbi:pyrin [Heterocephalus glaber]|uniref:Pyrin n=1 Tax=Heterocephalus glaber TaxID=10181 RepID=A0AAX6QLM0_HETGA|nr:pyrin [Heterocephalus glaber]
MAKTLSDHLLNTLEELVPYDFEKFKFKLQNTSLEKEHTRIPRGHLQMARPVRLATLLITHYGEEYAVRLTLQVLRSINQRLLAEELHRATGQELGTQESCIDILATYSGENKPKSLKVPDGPAGDEHRQSGNGAASLMSSQTEAVKGPQKKSQGKRRDPKGPEGLDLQGKLWARSAALPTRRSPVPTQSQPGNKENGVSTQLRRNASSAGRLQGLCTGALGRRESKKSEVYLPSGKKRPKSLELSSEKEGPPNPETLLTSLEEMRNGNADSAATSRVGAAVTLENGSRNPEYSMVMEEGISRITLSRASLAREEKSTASFEEEGTGYPDTLGKMTGGLFHKSSNPEVLSFSGRLQEEAACSLGHTQEGDQLGGTCVHGSCSGPVASGDSQVSGNSLPNCPQCQAFLARKSSGGVSPQALLQCQRHMKQELLLFCEDHGELICLICRLSQEHQGHRVRPIEEAALDYKEQIQKQLEHLKELRKSGEEQRSQGHMKTARFLKQTETQKQRVQCQLEQLHRFLEQQEQLFLTWLEELGQTIGQVQETYGTRVSQDIALFDELIGKLEAKQRQSEWELMQDIGVTLHRAKMVTVPEPWATPPEVKEKIHLLYQKSEFVEKSIKYFSDTLRSEMEMFNVQELTGAQEHAVEVFLDPATAHPNLVFSDDMKSVRLGGQWDRLPDNPERFDSCIFTLGSPRFFSGCHYWEVEVGNKTAWVLGVCHASTSRKGSVTLTPENGYWVVMMMKPNEYQASTIPPTHLRMSEPPKRVGIFLDWKTGHISFYNVTVRSHIYTFTSFSSSGPLQPIFSPGTHDGGKNIGPLTICAVDGQGPH